MVKTLFSSSLVALKQSHIRSLIDHWCPIQCLIFVGLAQRRSREQGCYFESCQRQPGRYNLLDVDYRRAGGTRLPVGFVRNRIFDSEKSGLGRYRNSRGANASHSPRRSKRKRSPNTKLKKSESNLIFFNS